MSWDFTRPVEIVPTGQADQRTLTILQEHEKIIPKPLGKGEDAPASKFFMSLGDCKLFRCTRCAWTGWIPVDQFEIR